MGNEMCFKTFSKGFCMLNKRSKGHFLSSLARVKAFDTQAKLAKALLCFIQTLFLYFVVTS